MMLVFKLVFVTVVVILQGVYSKPVIQGCTNCITSTETHGDGWLHVLLKHIDDDLSRRSDYQQLQLESGEEQDTFSRWLYKRQEVGNLGQQGHLGDENDETLSRIKRAPKKLPSSKDNIYSASSKNTKNKKAESKRQRTNKDSPGKDTKEYSNKNEVDNQSNHFTEETIDVKTKSSSLDSSSTNSKPNQNNTLQNGSFDNSSEEDDNDIVTTEAYVNGLVTMIPDSDEVNSDEDISTEDYIDNFTTESPSIEDDSQSIEDVDVTTEEPDKDDNSDEDVDVTTEEPDEDYSDEDVTTEVPEEDYSDEDTSTEASMIGTEAPVSIDSDESMSLEDDYLTTPHPTKSNNSMESAEDNQSLEVLPENPESIEVVPETMPNVHETIKAILTEFQSDWKTSKESDEEKKVGSKESEEDD